MGGHLHNIPGAEMVSVSPAPTVMHYPFGNRLAGGLVSMRLLETDWLANRLRFPRLDHVL